MSRAVSAVVVLALLVLALGCSAPSAQSQPTAAPPVKARELSFATYTPSEHHVTKVLTEFAKEVEQGTGGRVKITLYPGETLTKSAQTYDGVAKGIADMGFSFFSYNAGRFPLMEVVDLPLPGVKDSTHASLEAWEVYKKFQPKELSDIKLLGLLSMAGATLFTNKPITKLEDVAKQQIRGTGNDVIVIEALGGTAVAMPITEAYVALQKGICDGILTDDAAMLSYKFGDVVKSKVAFPGGLRQATAWYGMNLGVWNSLAPDIQKVIADVSTKYIAVLGNSRNAENAKGADYLISAAVKGTTLSATEIDRWQKALQPLRDRWVKDKAAMGLPAREALDFAVAALQK